MNVGRPKPLVYRVKEIESGFVKGPVSGALFFARTGLAGDGQADLRLHGGPEKAVCVYPSEHYPYWQERLGRMLEPAAFGENFTTRGLAESDVCLGDVFRIGGGPEGAVVQVSQPRQPCFKLAARHGEKRLALWVQETGLTGFYFRVLEEGEVAVGNGLCLLKRPAPFATVAEANRVMHRDRGDLRAVRRLLSVEELSASWRRTFEERLVGSFGDTEPRLSGPRPKSILERYRQRRRLPEHPLGPS